MREILYRGKGDKRYNDGGWYFGVPIKDCEGDWQICTHNCRSVVIPETITECTGAYDITAHLIFEGDKVDMGSKSYGSSDKGVVVYNTDECAFMIQLDNTCIPLVYEISSRIMVIGNIFDTP